jgi:hypothetical protein
MTSKNIFDKPLKNKQDRSAVDAINCFVQHKKIETLKLDFHFKNANKMSVSIFKNLTQVLISRVI